MKKILPFILVIILVAGIIIGVTLYNNSYTSSAKIFHMVTTENYTKTEDLDDKLDAVINASLSNSAATSTIEKLESVLELFDISYELFDKIHPISLGVSDPNLSDTKKLLEEYEDYIKSLSSSNSAISAYLTNSENPEVAPSELNNQLIKIYDTHLARLNSFNKMLKNLYFYLEEFAYVGAFPETYQNMFLEMIIKMAPAAGNSEEIKDDLLKTYGVYKNIENSDGFIYSPESSITTRNITAYYSIEDINSYLAAENKREYIESKTGTEKANLNIIYELCLA